MKVTRLKECSPSRVRAYKGIHKPCCNQGIGCGACWSKWEEANAPRKHQRQERKFRKTA